MSVSACSSLRLPGILAAAAAVAFLTCGAAGAQQQPSPPAPPRDNPGLVNELGKLLKAPESLLPSWSWPGSKPEAKPESPPAETLPAPPAASIVTAPAPPAAPAPAASPIIPAMIDGRQACPSSANGAADCGAGATILCRSKGYQQGRSLAVDATEKCSAKVLIPGRTREPGDCRTENFVTRAWCQ